MEKLIRDRNLGISLVVMATLFFTTMDSIAKHLVKDYSVVNITCIRYVLQIGLIMLIFGPRLGKSLFITRSFFPQAVRGLLVLGISLTFFLSLRYLPIAEATAITFLSPIMTTVLALILLKEKINRRIWVAVSLGLLGVIAIVQPGGELFSWAAGLPILTAVLYSMYEILTKSLSGTDSPYTSLFYAAVVGAIVSGLILPLTWQPPSWEQMLLLFLLSVVGLLAHYLLILALEYASVSSIQPYHFLSLVWACLSGYLIFGEVLDRLSVFGILIIAFSGILALEWKKVGNISK